MTNKDRSITPTLRKRASLNSLHGSGGATPPRSPAFRRASSHQTASPTLAIGAKSSLPSPLEETMQPPMTAASIAHDYFEKELSLHASGASIIGNVRTVVILQDECYGHRYSRPRTSRANLSTIVERPERIHACINGLAMAYIRLGGRHAEGDAAPHPKTHSASISAAPFRILKTARKLSLKSSAATAIHGVKWMNELSNMCDAAESKLALGGKELTRPSITEPTNGNARSEKPKLHEGDLYLCSQSLDALEGALGGVCEGVDAVFNDYGPNRAFVCIRPPGHHCSADMPSGFCWLNNVHVGIGHAVLAHGLTHAAIIDFDLHHGDGSQAITWAHNSRAASLPKNTPLSKRTAIGYFSLHDINSYPCEMGDDEKVRNASLCIENAHGQSIWNVHLQPWKTEAEFWQLYSEKYTVVLSKARNFLKAHSDRLRQAPTLPRPKAAIFLSAGFDASEWESPGMQRHQVNVPTDFYARLSSDVVAIAEEAGLGADGRVISVLEGGYSDRALISGVASHISGLNVVNSLYNRPTSNNGLGQDMDRRLGTLDIDGHFVAGQNAGEQPKSGTFDPMWWSLPQLEEIEKLVNPPTLIPATKKQRNDTRPTYTSTTQSYSAKVVSPSKNRRSLYGSASISSQHGYIMSRASSPLAPDVDWATATHELSKLLVPTDRETMSCRPEDLNAEASRARRDRHSGVGLPSQLSVHDLKPMQLRDRKSKPQKYASDDEEAKPVARARRRQTIADVSLLAEEDEESIASINHSAETQPIRHTRRRSSMASTTSSATADRGSDFSLGSAADLHLKENILFANKARIAGSHADATKPKIVKRPAATPISSGSSITSTSKTQEAANILKRDTTKALLTQNDELGNRDLDHLASGIKKMSIKLNVPPKSEYDARQTKPKPVPKGRPVKTAVPKSSKAASPAKSKVKPVKGVSLPAPRFNGSPIAHQLPPPAVSPDKARDTAVSPANPNIIPVDQLLQPAAPEPADSRFEIIQPPRVSYEASSNPPPTLDMHSEEDSITTPKPAPLKAPPEPRHIPEKIRPVTPVTAKRTKQDLPIFTSTSPISFGKPPHIFLNLDQTLTQNGVTASTTNRADSLPAPDLPASAGAQQHDNLALSTTMFSSENPGFNVQPKSSASIWDVPDTPQPRKS